MKHCFSQGRALLSAASLTRRPHTQCPCFGECWKWNWDPTGICSSASVQGEERQGWGHGSRDPSRGGQTWRTKAGEHGETMAEEQSQKRNRKAAAWEESWVAGRGCSCGMKGQKVAAIAEAASKEAKALGQVYLLWEWTAREKHNRQEKSSSLKGRGKKSHWGWGEQTGVTLAFTTALT